MPNIMIYKQKKKVILKSVVISQKVVLKSVSIIQKVVLENVKVAKTYITTTI